MPRTVSLCARLRPPTYHTPVEFGGSIASEGKGEYMYVEGRVLTTEGEPIADAVIETWEADHNGMNSIGHTHGCGRVLTVTRVLRHAVCR
jgi:protocatechuate 3,4-dioxygenase beta subunit